MASLAHHENHDNDDNEDDDDGCEVDHLSKE